jgi:peptide/nickel transport system substrate-binding protein
MRAFLVLGLILLAGSMQPGPARADKASDTLRVAWRDAIPDIDPYHNSLRTGLVVAQQAWDTLIYRDPDTFLLKPLLATSWRQTSDTTIEFTLRDGVHFHEGSPFSADDVVYTVQQALSDPKVAVPTNFAFLAGAEKIDDLHVRLTLKQAFPAALEYLAITLPILPKDYRERVGPDGYSKAPVGTGPYRITRVDGTTSIDLERNDAYFDGPKGTPKIGHLHIDEVADAAAELSALLQRRADWIWMFNPDQVGTIERDPELVALRAESMRFGYLSMDAAGRTGADNPLTNLKVRQAIMHAIDRETIARQLVLGGSRVLDAPCFPTQFGCDQAAAVRYDYDPAKSRALLAEAGFPQGFSTEIVSYIVPAWADAVQSYLKAVGIDAKLIELQTGPAVARSQDGEDPMDLGSWGSYSINDVSAVLPYFFGGGASDYARDPEVEKLVAEGDSITDPDRRRAAYSAAIRRITQQAYWLPLTTYVTTYGFSRSLNFKPAPDEMPRFYLSSWR